MLIAVTDFSAPIRASVFKFCVHLQVGKVYCVNENLETNPHFAFFYSIFHFSVCYSYTMTMVIFLSKSTQKLLDL